MKTDCRDILDVIRAAAEADAGLAGLYDSTLDYTRMYLYMKRRQKGCDGLGELNNLKDEVAAAFSEVIDYCAEKGVVAECAVYDIDMIAEELDRNRCMT